MDLVEVTLGAGILHKLARGRVLDQLGQLLSNLYFHLRIAVPLSRATSSPRWFT